LTALLISGAYAMNGRTNRRIVLDTNAAIGFIDGRIAVLPEGKHFVSVITEMELFASPLIENIALTFPGV
jgi:hypothetical protein